MLRPYSAGCKKLIASVKPQSFRTVNVVKTKARRDRTHQEHLMSHQPMLAASSRVRPRTPERHLAAEAITAKDDSPIFLSSPPRQVNIETAVPEVLAFGSSSLVRRNPSRNEQFEEYKSGEVSSFMNDSFLDKPEPTSIPKFDHAKDVLRYKELVQELKKEIKDKDGAIEKLYKKFQELKRVEYDTGKLEKEVARARKDHLATEAELRKVESQLLSVREQLLVKIESPTYKHGSGTALAEGTSTINGTGEQDLKGDVELLNLRDQVDVLRRALACRDNPFPDLQFGHKRFFTAPLVLPRKRKTFHQEQRTRKRGRPPRNIAALAVVQDASVDKNSASGLEFHGSSGGGANSTTSEYRGTQEEDEDDEDDEDGEEEEEAFKTKNERALQKFDRMAGVPQNPIACRADGLLAFKEGMRVRRSRFL